MVQLFQTNFTNIQSGDDFLVDDDSLDKLDAISMRVQGIGEALKIFTNEK